MADSEQDKIAIRAVRDQLRVTLAELDRLEIRMAGNEVNAAIEVLNDRLGEQADPAEIERLQRRHFSN
ncbi:protein of unknown function [uncultured Sphingopyxis sp.]|uniref:Uncharacterized protein n=1 Tax=uncultured Sphingopyxis sp. TaxID=310581 RepID=A0A1Y5PRU4_9SPHN|nr:hypothetical protein [uncultured Sphingopyxis sp.]SBV32710.1 protein of unknown function [uncultured Sphingopyxis sp.]